MKRFILSTSLLISALALSGLGAACRADEPADDAGLAYRVESALHSDPYLYARHVDVEIKSGQVILKGFVTSDWELAKAIRVATEAAGSHKVVDNIEIKEGGRR